MEYLISDNTITISNGNNIKTIKKHP